MGSSTVGLAPGLSRKLKKVLECRTDSPDLLSSLNTLSSFYTENTPQTRRNLRYTIETRALDINREFLRASDPAQRALDRVEEQVNALSDCCDRIAKALDSCSAKTGDIISTTERLKQELEITTQRQEIVSCFLRDYQLSNEEVCSCYKVFCRRIRDLSLLFFPYFLSSLNSITSSMILDRIRMEETNTCLHS